MTPVIKELRKQYPILFEESWWDSWKIRSLKFREGDVDIIHEMFGNHFLTTGIITLLAFSHGDSYPLISIKDILQVNEQQINEILNKLSKRKLVYTEKFGHPEFGIPFYFMERELLRELVRNYKLKAATHIHKPSSQSEKPFLAFVSSVLNKKIENLDTERQATMVGIEDLGFVTPWLFENMPASSDSLPNQFLNKVKDCDFFIIIIGKYVTVNVEKEFQAAKKSKRRILVFVKKLTNRSKQAQTFIKALNVKYKEFSNAEILREQVFASLLDEVIRAARKELCTI